MKACLTALACLHFAFAAVHADELGMKPMFNGRNLDGFTQRGGKAKYAWQDGQLVGTSVPGGENSFLCTDRDYSDFILEYEFKVDPPLNSGVQIRSGCYEKNGQVVTRSTDGKEKKRNVHAGRVHGYQVEIDPSDRAWSGGIYDEAGRGWLCNLADNEPARKAFKQNEWNKVRVVCQGDSIKTWLNGVPAADLTDDEHPTGFIAFQVHAVHNDKSKLGKTVRWRNIMIKELPAKVASGQ